MPVQAETDRLKSSSVGDSSSSQVSDFLIAKWALDYEFMILLEKHHCQVIIAIVLNKMWN
jgi:hypothetical protein